MKHNTQFNQNDDGFGLDNTQQETKSNKDPNTSKLSNECISNSHTRNITFDSKWLNDSIEIVTGCTTANKRQASVKILQNIAYLFSYGGMVTRGLPFYAVDLSPTGIGKTEVVKKSRQLFLSPVFEKQQALLIKDIERHKEEMLSAKGQEKEFIEIPKLHKCIHINHTSEGALFESFEAEPAQMVEIGELGRKLKGQKYQSLLDYIVEGFGATELVAPNYKNQRMSKVLKVEHPQLFFYGDTTIRYLGKKSFFEHIEGGLLNRCILIYNPNVKEFDDLPETYDLDDLTIQKYNHIAGELINFANQHKDIQINIRDITYRKECERYFYDKRKRLIDGGSPFANMYARTIQNFRVFINIFHLIECFDSKSFSAVINDSSVKQAFEFMKWQIEAYPLLMDEMSGVMDEIRVDSKTEKIIEYITAQTLPIPFRTLSRAHFGKKSDIQKILAGLYDFSKTHVLKRI